MYIFVGKKRFSFYLKSSISGVINLSASLIYILPRGHLKINKFFFVFKRKILLPRSETQVILPDSRFSK